MLFGFSLRQAGCLRPLNGSSTSPNLGAIASQALHVTGAAILSSRGTNVLPATPGSLGVRRQTGAVNMGFRVLLIAVGDKKPAVIHGDFGVVPTQEFEEIAESPVVGVSLKNGSYLLYINDPALIVPNDVVLARLSTSARLLACYANETCMESLATSWENGQRKWLVHHDAQQGSEHLETSGELPSQFLPIREKLFAQQQGSNEADYLFDTPVELAKELGGFRYDCDIEGAEGRPFQVLAQE